ncbi:MAG: cytochrome c [Bacteroidales bacterium]
MNDESGSKLMHSKEVASGNTGTRFSYQQKDRGIGPIKSIKLGAINPEMVEKGQGLFNSKCIICHDLDQKKIGPPLRTITITRTPEFIMNMMLNTAQMQQQDTVVRNLIRTYKVPMTPPNFSTEEARSVLEYLRSAVPKAR